jgi:hypothetical protein
MTERSYVPEGDWLPPGPMPIELETDVCGVVLAVADGGFITSTLVDGRYENPPCGGEHLAVGSCGPDPIRIEGQGNVHIRRYLMPGLTRADAEATPSTSEVVLAHAEAEVLLGTLGYVPADELVVDDLGPVPASHYHAARPPASPDEGCVLWVGVASGVGNASVTFSGPAGTGFMPANVSMDPAQSRATFALFACGASAGTIRGDSEASMYSVRATDAAIVYRAYAPPTATSPVTPGAPGASTVARARVVDVTHATLPTTVPFVHAEIE